MEQFFTVYGGALLEGFLITLFLLAALLFFVKRFWSNNNKTSLHHTYSPVIRFGGVALILGTLLTLFGNKLLVFPVTWWVFCAVLLLALLVGLWDDIRNAHWSFQLGAQVALLAILFFGGVKITSISSPLGGILDFSQGGFIIISFLLFLLWGIFILNAVNWLDGVDGLCASVLIITYSSIFFLALSPTVYQPPIALLCAILVGVTLGFFVYNYPKAILIGGTTSTLFFGLTLIFLSVVAGTKIATTLLVLALPILDALFVLGKRLQQKRSLFSPDKEHLHHILRARGWSDRSIVFFYSILTLCVSIIALSTASLGKFFAIILVFSLLAAILSFFHSKRKFSWFPIIILGVFLIAIVSVSVMQRETRSAWIAGGWYQLEVADSDTERAQGLSNRESLCARCGMLFLFPEAQQAEFWMKDMKFSLDILWLYEGKVVAKNENVPYPSLNPFGPDVLVDTVIELPAGATKDIPVGAKVYFW